MPSQEATRRASLNEERIAEKKEREIESGAENSTETENDWEMKRVESVN